MIRLKYPAMYSDELGGDKAAVYFGEDNVELKVRGFTFCSEYNDFDFYTKDTKKAKALFNLKDEELIEYVLDIRIPFIFTHDNVDTSRKLLLRIERQKNYYNNSLIFLLDDEIYKVEAYDFSQLLINMNKILPRNYKIKANKISLFQKREANISCIV